MKALLAQWFSSRFPITPLDELRETRAQLRRCAERCNRKRASTAISRRWYMSQRPNLSKAVVPLADALLGAQERGLEHVLDTISAADKMARLLIVPYTADTRAADCKIEFRSARLLVADVPARIDQFMDALSLELFDAVVKAGM